MPVHVTKAADVHEDIEAKFLTAVKGTSDLVVASAMTQAEVNDFRALRRCHALNNAANLPIGAGRVLVEQRCRQFHLERIVFHQVDKRRRVDRRSTEDLSGGSLQL